MLNCDYFKKILYIKQLIWIIYAIIPQSNLLGFMKS